MKYIFYAFIFFFSLSVSAQNCEGIGCIANPKIIQNTGLIECFSSLDLEFDDFQNDSIDECNNDCVEVCENSIVSFSTSYNIGSQYIWSVVGGDIINFNTFNNSVVVEWSNVSSGLLSVEEVDTNGCSKTDFICIDLKSTPQAHIQTLPGDSVFCIDTDIQFFGNNLNPNSLVEQECYPEWIYEEFYWYFDSLESQYSYSTHYYWDFGDGNTSSQANPIHSYASSGPKTVTLIMNNNCQCSDTITMELFINSDVGPKIESCIGASCEGDTILYCTDAEIPVWSINGGLILNNTINNECIKVVWDNNDNSLTDGEGTLIVADASTSCGSGQTYFSVPILSSNPTIVGSDLVCQDTYEVYSYECIPGIEYDWSVVGGTVVGGLNTSEIKVAWGAQQSGQVILNLSSSTIACSDIQTTLDVEILPSININGANTICEDQIYTYFDSQASNSIQWSVDNGTLLNTAAIIDNISNQIEVHFNQGHGPATINAIATQDGIYCQEMSSFNVNVIEKPQSILAISGDTIICPGESYIYTVLESNPDNQNSSYNWFITGGTPSSNTGESLSIEWDPVGPYEINVYNRLNNNPYCYSDTFSLSVITVPVQSPVIIGNTVSCSNSISTFQLETNYPTGAVISWSLTNSSYGSVVGGQGSSLVEIEWGNNIGFVDLNVQIEDCGQTFTASLPIELINNQVSFNLNSSLLCSEEALSFVASSGAGEYYWLFGDGTSSTAQSPLKTFNDPGFYNINLTFIDSVNQCLSTYDSTISVTGINGQLFPGGTSLFCSSGEINLPLNIVSYSTYSPSVEWFLNGLSLGNASDYTVVSSPPNYNNIGVYSVVITDEDGCNNTLNEITVDTVNCSGSGGWYGNDPDSPCPPLSNLIYSSSCNSDVGTNIFNFNSSDGSIVEWRLDDGPINSSVTSSYTFAEAGIHYVRARTAACLIGIEEISIPLVVDFTYSAVCNPLDNNSIAYHFNDVSSYLNGYGLANYTWDFGDGNTSADQNPIHSYSSNGTYSVRLTVDYGGYSCDKVIEIDHNDFGIDYSYTGYECEDTPTLTFLSLNNVTPISNWLWNFGDGSSSQRPSPQRTYSSVSNYNTTLQITDIYGCTADNSQSISIESSPIINSINNIPPVCSNSSPIDLSSLIDYNTTNGETINWNGIGVEQDTITQYYFFNPLLAGGGMHQICAIVTDNNACFIEKCIYIDVICPEKPEIFGNTDFCLPTDFENYTYTTQTGMSNYQWYVNGTPNLANYNTLNFYSYDIESMDLTVEFTDNNGCSSISEPFNISVNPLPSPFVANATTNVCPEQLITLSHDGNENNVSYQWNTPEKHSETTIEIISESNYDYYVIAINQFGCKRTSNFVSTHQAPNMCSVLSGCYCDSSIVNNSNNILITGVSPYGYYNVEWLRNGMPLPDPVLSNNLSLDLSDPNYFDLVPGTFNLQVTDNYGCVYNSEDLHIETNCSPCNEELLTNIQDTICEGESYLDNGINYDATGIYTTSFMTIEGCDTIVELDLTVLPMDTTYSNEVTCDSFNWNGNTFTVSGTYVYESINAIGCQTNILNLTINDTLLIETSAFMCGPYEWNGVTFYQSGLYSFESIDSNNCVNIEYLDLYLTDFDSLEIIGDSIIFANTSNTNYKVLNAKESSSYIWNIVNGSGNINATASNSSEIDIEWGLNDNPITLCVIEQDLYGCFGTESCIEITFEGINSIVNSEIFDLEVYPNPSRGGFNISFNLDSKQDVSLTISNYLGEVVYTEILKDQVGQYNKSIDLANKANGIYMLNITTNSENINQKIVIQ